MWPVDVKLWYLFRPIAVCNFHEEKDGTFSSCRLILNESHDVEQHVQLRNWTFLECQFIFFFPSYETSFNGGNSYSRDQEIGSQEEQHACLSHLGSDGYLMWNLFWFYPSLLFHEIMAKDIFKLIFKITFVH